MRRAPSNSDFKLVFADPIAGWHRWFAWHPVDTVDRGIVWMRPVWRRRCQIKLHLEPGGGKWIWQHVMGSKG